jgi:hypothetical protein
MIETKSSVTVEDKGLDKITKQMMQDQSLFVGYIESTAAQAATAIEYGIDDDENRSFMRKGLVRNSDAIFQETQKAVENGVKNKKPVDLQPVGEVVKQAIESEIDRVNESAERKIPDLLKEAIEITEKP